MRIYQSHGHFGIVTRQELIRDGATRRQIHEAEAAGHLTRVDRCRYAVPSAPADVVAAARADASLTCVSALALQGVWTMPKPELHLRRRSYSARARELPPNARLCSTGTPASTCPVDSIPEALCALVRHHPAEEAVMAMDCLLHQGTYTRAQLLDLLRPAGKKAERLLGRADGKCESALESIVRQRLRATGLRPRLQVSLKEIGRADMVLGDWLIIELDGLGFHDAETFHRDRRRDRISVRRGYLTIRITWHHVLTDWDGVLADILHVVRTRKHRR